MAKNRNHDISRRKFLKDAGIIAGGAAIGSAALLSACAGKTTTETVTTTVSSPPVTKIVETTAPAKTVTMTVPGSITPTTGAKITVLNPSGYPPVITLVKMAPRPASLNGQNVYLIDTGFSQGGTILLAMQKWFTQNMPSVKTIFKLKKGAYADDDPELFKEIQAAKGCVIMGLGG